DLPPSSFDFDAMAPGRVFTMAGERYQYLEDMGNGNHMIIRHDVIPNTSFNMQPQVLSNWFSGLDAAVQSIVQPVLIPTPVPNIAFSSLTMIGQGNQPDWLPTNLADFPTVAGDVTNVNPGGTPQAFALSLADVVRLSTEGGAFHNIRARSALHGRGWWLRTPGPSTIVWSISVVNPGGLGFAHSNTDIIVNNLVGVRPALIVHQ
ncbi:hypothetical protein ACI1TN_10365, partial [Lactococcus garvieae]